MRRLPAQPLGLPLGRGLELVPVREGQGGLVAEAAPAPAASRH